MWSFQIRLLVNKIILLSADGTVQKSETSETTAFSTWTNIMEGILLLRCNEESQLWSYGGQPYMRPNTMGEESRSSSEMG